MALLHLVQPIDNRRVIFGGALVRNLVDCASRVTVVSAREITGSGRSRDMVWTRWAISLIARENGRTLHQIADVLNKDHTTILHGIARAKELQDPEFDRLLELLREEAGR